MRRSSSPHGGGLTVDSSFGSLARFGGFTILLAGIFYASGIGITGDANSGPGGIPDAQASGRRAASLAEVQSLLASLGHSEYLEGMSRAGLDSLQLIADGEAQDRSEARVKIVHWRRIVQGARRRLRRESPPAGRDEPEAPPAVQKPARTPNPPAVERTPRTPQPPPGEDEDRTPKPPRTPPPTPVPEAPDNSEVESPPQAKASNGESYLLLSTLTAGFASGVRTQLLPFLALAAATKRTAVLPSASFGIPAFRTTVKDTEAGFVPLSTFIDVAELRAKWPCLKMVSIDEWRAESGNVVDSVVFLGRQSEIGDKATAGSGAVDPAAPALEDSCYAKDMAGINKKAVPSRRPYWSGPWDFWGETVHIVQTEAMKVKAVQCASLHACSTGVTLFSSAAGPLSAKRSVMIANFPGLVRDAFFWHSPYSKKEMYLFSDVPKKDICGPGTWPSFGHWPSPSPSWKGVASDVVSDRFGGSKFMCVHIRGEKMVLRMHSERKIPLNTLFRDHSHELARCVDGMARIIVAAMRKEGVQSGGLFLISDLDPETGSPSSARDRFFRNWTAWAGARLQRKTGGGKGFCGTEAAAKATASGPDDVRHALKIYPGNCAMGEAAVCQSASVVLRFGQGSMGRFVSANAKRVAHYQSCEEAQSARPAAASSLSRAIAASIRDGSD